MEREVSVSLAPCALGRLVGVAVPPTLRRLKSRRVVAPPAIRHLSWTVLLKRKTLLLSGFNESLFTENLASPLVLCPKSRTVDKLPARSINVFLVTAEHSYILSVAGHGGNTITRKSLVAPRRFDAA